MLNIKIDITYRRNIMSNNVTWSLPLTPENATKIDAVNRILLGELVTTSAAKAPIEKASKKVEETASTAEVGVSQSDLQEGAKAAKSAHDVDFVKECITACGGTLKRALGQSLSSIPAERHEEFLAMLTAGPQDSEEELEDDGLDDDLDGEDEMETPDADAVKDVIRAYNKEHGKEKTKALMTKHGLASLSAVTSLEDADLIKVFKAFQ